MTATIIINSDDDRYGDNNDDENNNDSNNCPRKQKHLVMNITDENNNATNKNIYLYILKKMGSDRGKKGKRGSR